MNKRELRRKMSELGRAGAEARTKALSPERRKEIATVAANTRWKNIEVHLTDIDLTAEETKNRRIWNKKQNNQ